MMRVTIETRHTVTDEDGNNACTTTERETIYHAPHYGVVTITAHTLKVSTPLFEEDKEHIQMHVPSDNINRAIVEYIATLNNSEPGGATETLARMAEAMGLSYHRPTSEV